MIHARLDSASGLRPASAFVVIGAVLVLVAGRVASEVLGSDSSPARWVREEPDSDPAFEISDRHGSTLAQFAKRFDVEASPRSLWLGHTPERVAKALHEVLSQESAPGAPRAELEPEALLESLFPGARGGWLEARGLVLGARSSAALEGWLAASSLDCVKLRADAQAGGYTLSWKPRELLAESTRLARGVKNARTWSRKLVDGLLACIDPAGWSALCADGEKLERERMRLWNQLMPSGRCVPLRDLSPQAALDLDLALRVEGINPKQMRVLPARERRYPLGPSLVLGDWGYPDPQAREIEPRAGLELLGQRLLGGADFDWIDPAPAVYSFVRNKAAGERMRPYFVASTPAQPAAIVHSTLDAPLQGFLRTQLERVMQDFEPAVAMGIALDLASGEVLAVDGLSAYGHANFLPIHHQFTPGSTFKVVTMAVALEEGAVEPDTVFDVGHGSCVVRDARGRTRTIREAENSGAVGRVSASGCLAHSSNAGMAQIGMRVPADRFRAHLLRLHYGRAPGTGLGSEARGYLAALPWVPTQTQASICFGHEFGTSLWQHAAALAAVVRGGAWLPLRVLAGASQGARHAALAPAQPERVFAPRTSELVREMMRMGAREGTGKPVLGTRDDLVAGSKTGTAEKVAGEVCEHAYGRALERAAKLGRGLTQAEYKAVKAGGPAHKGSCYTSSMCVFGRRVEGGREVIALVVVDEPTKGGKFGSRVAGPTAVRLLDEALGITRGGERPVPLAFGRFAPSDSALVSTLEHPWKERPR